MRRTPLAVAAAALVVASCGGASDGTTEQVAAPAAPTETAPAADGSDLEPRPLALASGETVDFNGLLGQDVLFWFWAPW